MAKISLQLNDFKQSDLAEEGLREWNVPSFHPVEDRQGKENLIRLKGKHRIMQDLEMSGLTSREIARMLGLTDSRVSLIRSSPLYQAGLQQKMALQSKETSDLIQNLAIESVVEMRELARHSKNEKIRLSAAKWLVENAGFRAPERREVDINFRDTVEEARLLAEQRRSDLSSSTIEIARTFSESEISALEDKYSDAIEDYSDDEKMTRRDPLDILFEMNTRLEENSGS